jgi:hypothetical protein
VPLLTAIPLILTSTNAVLDVEVIAAGTQFAANAAQRQVFDVLVDGNRWMIFYNTISGILHFDFVRIR